MHDLNPELPIPLYHQLKELIRYQIASGALVPGDQLPTELELEVRYGISRVTVRQALRDLVSEGLLTRRRAIGTFVALPKIDKGLKSALSFTADMKTRGLAPGARVLRLAEVAATNAVAAALDLPPATPVIYIQRLRLASGEPLALQWCCLQASRFPGLLAEDLSNQSLYYVLASKFGVSIMSSRRTIEGVVADRRAAEILEVQEGAPLLLLGGTNLDQTGRSVETGETLYRADKYKFNVDF